MNTLAILSENIRRNCAEKVVGRRFRIAWKEDGAYLQQLEIFERQTIGGRQRRWGAWQTIRPATTCDMADLYAGRIGYDRSSEPR